MDQKHIDGANQSSPSGPTPGSQRGNTSPDIQLHYPSLDDWMFQNLGTGGGHADRKEEKTATSEEEEEQEEEEEEQTDAASALGASAGDEEEEDEQEDDEEEANQGGLELLATATATAKGKGKTTRKKGPTKWKFLDILALSTPEVQAVLAKEKEDIERTGTTGTSEDKKNAIHRWISQPENELAPVPVYAKNLEPKETESTLVVGCHRNGISAHKISAPFSVESDPPRPLLYGCLYHPETEQTLSYFACKDKIYFAAGDEPPREAEWDTRNNPNLSWALYADTLFKSTQITDDHAYEASFALSWQHDKNRFVIHDIFVQIHGWDGLALPYWKQGGAPTPMKQVYSMACFNTYREILDSKGVEIKPLPVGFTKEEQKAGKFDVNFINEGTEWYRFWDAFDVAGYPEFHASFRDQFHRNLALVPSIRDAFKSKNRPYVNIEPHPNVFIDVVEQGYVGKDMGAWNSTYPAYSEPAIQRIRTYINFLRLADLPRTATTTEECENGLLNHLDEIKDFDGIVVWFHHMNRHYVSVSEDQSQVTLGVRSRFLNRVPFFIARSALHVPLSDGDDGAQVKILRVHCSRALILIHTRVTGSYEYVFSLDCAGHLSLVCMEPISLPGPNPKLHLSVVYYKAKFSNHPRDATKFVVTSESCKDHELGAFPLARVVGLGRCVSYESSILMKQDGVIESDTVRFWPCDFTDPRVEANRRRASRNFVLQPLQWLMASSDEDGTEPRQSVNHKYSARVVYTDGCTVKTAGTTAYLSTQVALNTLEIGSRSLFWSLCWHLSTFFAPFSGNVLLSCPISRDTRFTDAVFDTNQFKKLSLGPKETSNKTLINFNFSRPTEENALIKYGVKAHLDPLTAMFWMCYWHGVGSENQTADFRMQAAKLFALFQVSSRPEFLPSFYTYQIAPPTKKREKKGQPAPVAQPIPLTTTVPIPAGTFYITPQSRRVNWMTFEGIGLQVAPERGKTGESKENQSQVLVTSAKEKVARPLPSMAAEGWFKDICEAAVNVASWARDSTFFNYRRIGVLDEKKSNLSTGAHVVNISPPQRTDLFRCPVIMPCAKMGRETDEKAKGFVLFKDRAALKHYIAKKPTPRAAPSVSKRPKLPRPVPPPPPPRRLRAPPPVADGPAEEQGLPPEPENPPPVSLTSDTDAKSQVPPSPRRVAGASDAKQSAPSLKPHTLARLFAPSEQVGLELAENPLRPRHRDLLVPRSLKLDIVLFRQSLDLAFQKGIYRDELAPSDVLPVIDTDTWQHLMYLAIVLTLLDAWNSWTVFEHVARHLFFMDDKMELPAQSTETRKQMQSRMKHYRFWIDTSSVPGTNTQLLSVIFTMNSDSLRLFLAKRMPRESSAQLEWWNFLCRCRLVNFLPLWETNPLSMVLDIWNLAVGERGSLKSLMKDQTPQLVQLDLVMLGMAAGVAFKSGIWPYPKSSHGTLFNHLAPLAEDIINSYRYIQEFGNANEIVSALGPLMGRDVRLVAELSEDLPTETLQERIMKAQNYCAGSAILQSEVMPPALIYLPEFLFIKWPTLLGLQYYSAYVVAKSSGQLEPLFKTMFTEEIPKSTVDFDIAAHSLYMLSNELAAVVRDTRPSNAAFDKQLAFLDLYCATHLMYRRVSRDLVDSRRWFEANRLYVQWQAWQTTYFGGHGRKVAFWTRLFLDEWVPRTGYTSYPELMDPYFGDNTLQSIKTWNQLEDLLFGDDKRSSVECQQQVFQGDAGFHFYLKKVTLADRNPDNAKLPKITPEMRRYYSEGGRSVFFLDTKLNSNLGHAVEFDLHYLKTFLADYRPVFVFMDPTNSTIPSCSSPAERSHVAFQASNWPGSFDLVPGSPKDKIHRICPQNWRLPHGLGRQYFNILPNSAVSRLSGEWAPDVYMLKQWPL